MTYDNTSTEESLKACGSKGDPTNPVRDTTATSTSTTKTSDNSTRPNTPVETFSDEFGTLPSAQSAESEILSGQMLEIPSTSAVLSGVCPNEATSKKDSNECPSSECNNHVLNDEIKSRLEKLNALSDLINSLERQFDEANSLFRETLKCSTDRLSSIAKTLGSKSIRQGRVYRAAKLSVEQSQSDCQRACVQFEQANKDHQVAKDAIRAAELKLKKVALLGKTSTCVPHNLSDPISIDSVDFNAKLKLTTNEFSTAQQVLVDSTKCDKTYQLTTSNGPTIKKSSSTSIDSTMNPVEPPNVGLHKSSTIDAQTVPDCESDHQQQAHRIPIIDNAAIVSEELNQAIVGLIEAERKRGQSEMLHLTEANKLMVAQENLTKLEREYGPSVKRAQLYFDEAKRFNVRLSSVKGDISRISDDISVAKQAYARTLSELERFSDDLHDLKTRAHSATT